MNVLIRPQFPRLYLPRTFSLILRNSYFSRTIVNEISSDDYIQAEPDLDDEIVVAMSSGVDSSVTAALYASKYRNVRGIYMANWSQTAKCTESDWNDVKKVCHHLNIPCERVNFEKEYWNDVFVPMISMYEQGLTPNPDTNCNKYVKFGKMIQHLREKFKNTNKNWWLVTGHYARVMKSTATQDYRLLRSYYGNKDQSFYLSSIPKEILPKILMPIGHLTKPKVRELAEQFNLHTAKKPDSQGLCFVNPDDKKFYSFLNDYINPKPGNIITEDGKIWGQHQGLWYGTIGQKLGVSMPQGNPNYKGVWFISEKRFDTNDLVIVKGRDNPKLYKIGLKIKDWQWLISDPDTKLSSGNLTIQFRSLQQPLPIASINMDTSDITTIELKEKARAMAPGQNVVLYDNNEVLGSGILYKTF